MSGNNSPRPLSRSNSKNYLGVDNQAFDAPNRKASLESSHATLGPVRKKSNLHKAGELEHNFNHITIEADTDQNDRTKKMSTISVKSITFSKVEPAEDHRTWWYELCLKCHTEDDGRQSWEPKQWRTAFPRPYCPSYRTVSRIVALALIGTLSWCILYSVVGDAASPPDGRLYQVILLSICAHIGGWLISLTTLPALVGMLFTGMLFQNVGIVNVDSSFAEIIKIVSDIALVIILIRAGLDLDPSAVSKLKYTVLKLALIPWTTEAVIIMVLARFCLGIPWSYSVLLGSIIAAVSPAVVVPCLFRLRSKGYGVAKGIPTLIIAVASIDDSSSVAIFGIIKTVIFSDSSTASVAILGPLSIICGIIFGVLWGMMCNFIPERNDPFLVPLRILLLLAGGMGAVFGSDLIGYSGAGPLACVAAAFVSSTCWSKMGWDIEENPAATSFEIFWLIFQPILFGVTGARIKLDELDGSVVLISIGIIAAGIVIRMMVTFVVAIGCNLNLREKIFVSIPWMCKAIVQAALGPAVLSLVEPNTEEAEYGKKILNTCILSILVSAPTGAFLTTLLGPHLLTKAKMPSLPEIRKRKKSRRLSMYDISLVEPEEYGKEEHHMNGNVNPKFMVVIEESENGTENGSS